LARRRQVVCSASWQWKSQLPARSGVQLIEIEPRTGTISVTAWRRWAGV
jgi:hypothetical protein